MCYLGRWRVIYHALIEGQPSFSSQLRHHPYPTGMRFIQRLLSATQRNQRTIVEIKTLGQLTCDHDISLLY
jgi:hypothetical protein